MDDRPVRSGEVAAFLARCLETGWDVRADIERWADQLIQAHDNPPHDVLSLSLASRHPIQDVLRELRGLAGSTDEVLVGKLCFAFLWHQYSLGKVDLKRALRMLEYLNEDAALSKQEFSTLRHIIWDFADWMEPAKLTKHVKEFIDPFQRYAFLLPEYI